MLRLVCVLAGVVLLSLPARAQDTDPTCASDIARHEFDFWIGDWTVRNAQGVVVGHNHIERAVGGCALLEHWTGTGGSTGRSMNFRDAESGTWRQVWVDGAGGHMDYRGHLDAGAIRFEGKSVRPDGTTSRMHMTFTPLDDGRVRQYIEESTDDGATWATWFDGYYERAR